METDYDEENGVRTICRTYAEVAALWVNVTCPYCGDEWQEYDKADCGSQYTLTCENETCKRTFAMYFDAD